MLKWLHLILKDLLFPKQCFGCGCWGWFICVTCREQLRSQKFQRCIVCQKPSLGGWTHPRCKTKFTPGRLITIFDYHQKIISQAINTGKLALAPEVFIELAECGAERIEIRHAQTWRFVLCPIPQTPTKTRWRGFNQSELIATVFSNKFGLAIDHLLLKSKNTRQQKTLNKLERGVNLRSAFKLTSTESLSAEVILIDDITTTGATFLEATKVLKRGGIKTVWCLALAQD